MNAIDRPNNNIEAQVPSRKVVNSRWKITIKSRLGMAAHTVFNTMARVISSRFLYPRLDAIIPAITITPIPHKRPGRYPAMNSAEIDTLPATVEYTIRVLLGGISIPVGADAILTAAI